MGTKRKNRNHAQKTTERDSTTLQKYWRKVSYIVGLLAIALTTYFLFLKQKELAMHPELHWSNEMITANPENTKRFIEARLSHIADNLPSSCRHPVTGDRPVKNFLQDFLAAKELDKALNLINDGEAALKNGPPVSLTLLPDYHVSALGEQTKESKWRQRKIRDYIVSSNVSLVFAEGSSGDLTWESLHHDMIHTGRELNLRVPASLEEFKKWRQQLKIEHWWDSFLDKDSPKIFGIDELAINKAVLLLDSLDDPALPEEAYHNTAMWLNFTFRDQLILAKAIREMRSRHITEAYIVLGAGHLRTFFDVCQKWDVKFMIVTL